MDAPRTLVALVLVAGLAGCAAAAPPSAGTSASARTTAAVDRSDPGSVAVAFTMAVAGQDYAAASTLLDPSKRGILSALALGATGSTAKASGNLSSGRQQIANDRGTVALVGRLCREASGAQAPTVQVPDCIENRDPDTDSPLFTAHVVRIDGQWYATFAMPTATGSSSTHPPS